MPPSVARDLSGQPLQTIAPVDQVQVAHASQGSLITVFASPSATCNADKSVVEAFRLFEEPMG